LKSNNPANQINQAAKSRGLSYWEYMESTQPYHVQKFVWGAKKETRKDNRETQQELIDLMSRPGNPMSGLFAQMRSLFGKRSAY